MREPLVESYGVYCLPYWNAKWYLLMRGGAEKWPSASKLTES